MESEEKKSLIVGLFKNFLFVAMFVTWYGGAIYWWSLDTVQRMEPLNIILLFIVVVSFMLQFTPGLPFTHHKLVCQAFEQKKDKA